MFTVCCSNLTCYHGNQTEHCYLFRNESRDWKIAEVDCVQLGGHLATAKDTTEQSYLESLMKTYNQRTIWIGGEDVEDDNWHWIDGKL